ncbi:phosphotransferase [Arthrobacter sp. Br18]|uniref:phosphotransferase n=1 Tax=Arthrobacter sp. Br18 TaxID=1312954 RepID=UPI0020A6C595|nr:phosphotransferase [Arthrobacter sp. Br18]
MTAARLRSCRTRSAAARERRVVPTDSQLPAIQVGSPVWFHGDVATGNFLVRGGRLSAVIDWPGRPAEREKQSEPMR